jgi:Predicted membrane protein
VTAPESAGTPEPDAPVESPLPSGGTTHLADGEWHRLHPATPLLRGGLALVAIAGILIANLRERLVELLLPGFDWCRGDDCPDVPGGDPISYLIDEGYLLIGLAAALGVVLVIVAFFYVSWRMHTFRITDEVVEVRSGVLFRTHRKARLDRIQGVSINRPLFARIFGAAKLEVEVAGQDANVQLAYLGNALSDGLRADILRLASGARAAEAPAATPGSSGSLLDRRVAELLAPELDPNLAPPESVVRIPASRLIGSSALSVASVFVVLVIVATVIILVLGSAVAEGFYWTLFTLVPMAIGFGSYLVNRVIKFLRYSIAATPDGVRIGYGLLSIRNETLPPGRIHSVAVSQSLLWRPMDWWTIRVNRASRGSSTDGGQQAQQSTVVLPVGTRDDVFRVLGLLLPELVGDDGETGRDLFERGLVGRDRDDDFTTSPRRAAVLRWFSWRRNGFALLPGAVLQRRGAIWRELAIVPLPRVQSVAIEQGPLERALRLAGINVHTVAGPVATRLGALDASDAEGLFRDAAAASIAAAQADRTHRWREGEVGA